MTGWLLLIYKVPNEPSARRVYVWRKLKSMGALLLQDSAWVLPANARTREQMQWLATEIKDMDGGAATLWEAREVFTGQGTDLVERFLAQVDALYADILAQLAQADADLTALSRQFQLAEQQDYFHSPRGSEVRAALMKQKGEDET